MPHAGTRVAFCKCHTLTAFCCCKQSLTGAARPRGVERLRPGLQERSVSSKPIPSSSSASASSDNCKDSTTSGSDAPPPRGVENGLQPCRSNASQPMPYLTRGRQCWWERRGHGAHLNAPKPSSLLLPHVFVCELHVQSHDWFVPHFAEQRSAVLGRQAHPPLFNPERGK